MYQKAISAEPPDGKAAVEVLHDEGRWEELLGLAACRLRGLVSRLKSYVLNDVRH